MFRHKIAISGLALLTLFVAGRASAQTCTSILSDLSVGSRGAQVSQLQSFLVAQNYPGGGAWMVTGYYGNATAAAVRNFQQTHGLAQTGVVDATTRAAINSVSCGGSYLPGLGGTGYAYNNYPYNYNYNNYYNQYPPPFAQGYGGTQYNYNYPYGYNNYYNYNQYGCGSYPYFYSCPNYGTTPHLTSLSTAVAQPGTSVTIYGTGFDPMNNAVYVGGTTLSNISSPDGVSLVFTVPATAMTVTSVSVGNSRGTSNALTLNVGTYPYNYPPYNYPCGYPYNTTNCPPNNTQSPTLSYLSPVSGGVGTAVTVYGSGFTSTGNTVHFGNGIIANLTSFDGRSVSFTPPATLAGFGYQPVQLGTYNVSVTNSSGFSSNALPFTITSTGQSGAATITSVSGPTNLGVGVNGTWSITIQNPSSAYVTTSVNWGDLASYANQNTAQTTYTQGQTMVTFSHAYYAAGTYTVTFTVSNGSGQQNTSSATVIVSGSGSTGSISLSSLSPTTGPVGTQTIIYGTGFDALNNTVHFGIGGTMHVPSQNGVIYYTVPFYVSPCDLIGPGCAAPAQQVTAGSYQVYVTSPNGTSNTLNFQVQ